MNNNENRSNEEFNKPETASEPGADLQADTENEKENISSDRSVEANAHRAVCEEEADGFVDDAAFNDNKETKAELPKGSSRNRKNWHERSLPERLVTLIPTLFIMAVFALAVSEFKLADADIYEFVFSVAIMLASIAVGAFCIRLGRVWGWIVTALTPAAAFFLAELFTHNPVEDIPGKFIALNLGLYYGFAIFILFITGSMKASVVISAALPMLFGITNYYVLEFRGTPFFMWDIASAGIAADVVDNYEFIVSWHVCFLVCAFLFIIQLGFLCTPRIRLKLWWLRAPIALISAVALFMTGAYIQTDKGVKKLGIYPYLFSPKQVYKINGTGITFAYTVQFAGIDKPAGYSADAVAGMLSEYESEPVDENSEMPNVIVIMNEAFSDLKTIVDYAENIPVTPYINSMAEDTVKGTLHVSVKGGNTANSEFEFLTGISMANMTPGCIPYQQHIKGETPTIVKQFEELGYKTAAMHPYGATGWKRDQVYEWFGFDEMYFSTDFNGYEKIRNYYSDAATYQKIIELYENKKEGQPLFVFDVTMQNHGGYSTAYENLTPDDFIMGIPTRSSVNTYLTLINKSDEAFGELVEYFKAQDENTVILMFGDHQPHDSYVKPLLDRYNLSIESGSLDEQLKRYTVPFVMWANYDIEEETGIDTSINYLSSMLCEKAGIPRTSTQMYLSDLAEKYPVITEGHYGTDDGVYRSAADMDSIDELVAYEMLSYNMIVDNKNTLEEIYSYD